MSLVTLMDLAIKRIIRMAMKISPFVNMCQEDQIALLKGGCTELMVLKSVLSYDPENNSWRVSWSFQTIYCLQRFALRRSFIATQFSRGWLIKKQSSSRVPIGATVQIGVRAEELLRARLAGMKNYLRPPPRRHRRR